MILNILEGATIAFFVYVTALTVASEKLNIWERLAAFLCGLFINTYYLVDMLIRNGVTK